MAFRLEDFNGRHGHWSVVTCHCVILLPNGGFYSGKQQAIKAVPACGRWTPARVRFVTSPFHCLHELN